MGIKEDLTRSINGVQVDLFLNVLLLVITRKKNGHITLCCLKSVQHFCLNIILNLTNFMHPVNWHITCTFTNYRIINCKHTNYCHYDIS